MSLNKSIHVVLYSNVLTKGEKLELLTTKQFVNSASDLGAPNGLGDYRALQRVSGGGLALARSGTDLILPRPTCLPRHSTVPYLYREDAGVAGLKG